jgi:integrase
LQWGDIGDGLISVCHNYQDLEGVKAPKCGSSRIVPLPDSVKAALEEVRKIVLNPRPDSLVMESLTRPGKPFCNTHFTKHLSRILSAIGIPGEWAGKEAPPEGYVNEQQRRNLTFHSLRHSYITLGRLAGLTDMEIQALAGHKSGAMMSRYSHASQVLVFTAAREKLEKIVEEKKTI